MLKTPTPAEREILGAIEYQENEAILHTDASVLPRNRRAWASWNYHIPDNESRRVALTYHMNTLQRIEAPVEFCVTLNHDGGIDPTKSLKRITLSPSGVRRRRPSKRSSAMRKSAASTGRTTWGILGLRLPRGRRQQRTSCRGRFRQGALK
jgi:predicted NAD/FAD-binding protein